MNKRAKGCFKGGCIGCLALIGLSVGLVFLFGAVQMSTDWGDPVQEQREVTRDLPAIAGTATGAELPPISLGPLPEPAERAPEVAGGRLEIDLSMGEFSIVPGPPGEPIRVKADYDTNAFELRETFTERDGGGWVYKVDFSGRGGFFGMMMRGSQGGRNRIEIVVPRDHPIEIVGKIGLGESEIDLGGLWLRAVDLELGMGDHFLEFREPTRYAVETIKIDGSMGNLELRGLGRASPRQISVDMNMGEILVDLAGDWRGDSTVEVDFSMGDCRVWLPENVRVDVTRARVSMGERHLDLGDDADLPADAPTLVLSASGSMGQLQIRR